MSTVTQVRPLPVFNMADALGSEHAGEILVECTHANCDGWVESHSTLDKAMNAFDLHLNDAHIGYAITEKWQAAEVLYADYGGDAEAEHVWHWIRDHLEGLPSSTTPQYYLAAVMQAASSLASYAEDLVNRAAHLKAQMPLDAEAEMV